MLVDPSRLVLSLDIERKWYATTLLHVEASNERTYDHPIELSLAEYFFALISIILGCYQAVARVMNQVFRLRLPGGGARPSPIAASMVPHDAPVSMETSRLGIVRWSFESRYLY